MGTANDCDPRGIRFGPSPNGALTVSASLLQIVLLLALVAGSAMLLVGLDLITGSHVGPWRQIVLLTPSVLWSIGSSLLILAIVTRYALRVREPRRIFAVGFALTGWPILLAGFAPLWGEDVPVLWTSEVLHDLSGLPEPAPLCLALHEINSTMPGSGTFLFSAVLEEDSTLPSRYSSLPVGVRITGDFLARYLQFLLIGHCLVSLAIATVAGWLASTLAARRNALSAPANASDPVQEPSPVVSPLTSLLVPSRQVFPGRNT